VSRGGPQRPVRVAIIGAGLGGLAAAVKLRQRTSAEFVIFEQAASIGGTWRDNRYPGCEVDIHSHAYSYSFLKYEWPRTHALQPELLAYAEHVIDVFGLAPHLRLNTQVTGLTWEESTARYVLATADGEQHEFDAVISATGLLSVPRYPDWPGLAAFAGPCFHTARWEPEHDLSGKTVAIVGTGSTAVQVVPAIAPDVAQLYVYQREPGWIEPKAEREFTQRELWFYRHVPLAQRANRAWLFYQATRLALLPAACVKRLEPTGPGCSTRPRAGSRRLTHAAGSSARRVRRAWRSSTRASTIPPPGRR
jgi:cation diffusion facilitator CzcD-associated flavoprotein CzcO